MVQEPDTLSQAAAQNSLDADGLPPLEIDDQTAPEVLQQEDSFVREGDASVRDVEQPDTGTEEPTEPGTETASPETDNGIQAREVPPTTEQAQETPETEQARRERLFSQEEVRKMQSAYDRQIAEQNKRLKEIEANFQRQQVDNQVEAELQRQEQALAEQVGESEARRIARNGQNVQSVRDAVAAQAELKQVQQERNQYQQQSMMSAMNAWVGKLSQDHGLAPDDANTLLGLVTPATLSDPDAYVQTGEAMAMLAQRLASASGKRQTLDEDRKNLVPRETPETALESGQSISPAPPNDDSAMDSIMAKPSWEWTDEEAALVNRRGG